eukprot:480333-Amphidinium_carterae.1
MDETTVQSEPTAQRLWQLTRDVEVRERRCLGAAILAQCCFSGKTDRLLPNMPMNSDMQVVRTDSQWSSVAAKTCAYRTAHPVP